MTSAARRRTRLLAGAALMCALLGVGTPAGAGADDVPSVSVSPAYAEPDDPDGGQWFVLELGPGQSGTVVAKISNPAGVPQRVVLYTRDLSFTDQGTPVVVEGEQSDVGAWSVGGPKTLLLGPRETVLSEMTVTAPQDADPGDHVGVLVAQTSNKQQGYDIVRQVATRLYVTLPGAATRALNIDAVTPRTDSRWFPRRVTTDVTLANVGRVRLRPSVQVGSQTATGPPVLLSRSVERYTATQRLPWYGGLVKLPVQAKDDSGLSRTVDKSMVVVPWGLLLLVAAAGLVGWRVRRWWRGRTTQLDALQADLRRLERLMAAQALAAVGPRRIDDGADAEPADVTVDRVHDLMVAIKRAQRAGAHDSLARLALDLHAVGGPALPVLLDALPTAPDDQRDAVVAAIGSYDAAPTPARAEPAPPHRPPDATPALALAAPPAAPAAAWSASSRRPRRAHAAPGKPSRSAAAAPAARPEPGPAPRAPLAVTTIRAGQPTREGSGTSTIRAASTPSTPRGNGVPKPRRSGGR